MADLIKYNRSYSAYFDTAETPYSVPTDTLIIELPTTFEFDIYRTFLATNSNSARFRIYNLSETHRNALRFNVDNQFQTRKVLVLAGYQSDPNSAPQLYTIFSGCMSRASSIREGVNFITTIQCLDTAYNMVVNFLDGNVNQTSSTFPAGSSMANVYEQMIGTLPGTTLNAIGNFPNKTKRAMSLTGYTTDILNELSNGNFFIDNGTASVLNVNEFISAGETLEVDAAAGLLGTPQLENNNLHFDMIFEPRLQIGNQILLTSLNDASFNDRLWIVREIRHNGMISASVAGEAVTSVTCTYFSTQIPVDPFS